MVVLTLIFSSVVVHIVWYVIANLIKYFNQRKVTPVWGISQKKWCQQLEIWQQNSTDDGNLRKYRILNFRDLSK